MVGWELKEMIRKGVVSLEEVGKRAKKQEDKRRWKMIARRRRDVLFRFFKLERFDGGWVGRRRVLSFELGWS